jgi:ABC-type branched-subunit amino acid transport system permease subunit
VGILGRFFDFIPEPAHDTVVAIASKFVGVGWQLTLGLLFVLVVVFLPGGIMEGVRRIASMFGRSSTPASPGAVRAQPAE